MHSAPSRTLRESDEFSESTVEVAALAWLAELGYDIAAGPDLLPDGLFAERSRPGEVFLRRRLGS